MRLRCSFPLDVSLACLMSWALVGCLDGTGGCEEVDGIIATWTNESMPALVWVETREFREAFREACGPDVMLGVGQYGMGTTGIVEAVEALSLPKCSTWRIYIFILREPPADPSIRPRLSQAGTVVSAQIPPGGFDSDQTRLLEEGLSQSGCTLFEERSTDRYAAYLPF